MKAKLQEDIIDNDKIIIKINKNVYSPKAIRLASHKYSENYFINIEEQDFGSLAVNFKPKKENTDSSKISAEFLNELLEYQLRIDLENRFGETRKEIIKAAFSPLTNKE